MIVNTEVYRFLTAKEMHCSLLTGAFAFGRICFWRVVLMIWVLVRVFRIILQPSVAFSAQCSDLNSQIKHHVFLKTILLWDILEFLPRSTITERELLRVSVSKTSGSHHGLPIHVEAIKYGSVGHLQLQRRN